MSGPVLPVHALHRLLMANRLLRDPRDRLFCVNVAVNLHQDLERVDVHRLLPELLRKVSLVMAASSYESAHDSLLLLR